MEYVCSTSNMIDSSPGCYSETHTLMTTLTREKVNCCYFPLLSPGNHFSFGLRFVTTFQYVYFYSLTSRSLELVLLFCNYVLHCNLLLVCSSNWKPPTWNRVYVDEELEEVGKWGEENTKRERKRQHKDHLCDIHSSPHLSRGRGMGWRVSCQLQFEKFDFLRDSVTE